MFVSPKPLSEYSSLKTGGIPPKLYITNALEAVENNLVNENAIILGSGSNVVISSKIAKEVILIRDTKLEPNFEQVVEIDAGVNWDTFVLAAINNGYYGVEFMSGIPSTVGGAIVQNIGAYGQELSNSILKVRVFDKKTNELKYFNKDQCEFEYRNSLFKHKEQDRYLIVSAVFKLSDKPSLNQENFYLDITNWFEENRTEDSLMARRQAILEVRKSKSMIIDPLDQNTISVGSFFVNPILEQSIAKELYGKFNWDLDKSYSYDARTGNLKVSAAKLMHESGFQKGDQVGKCRLSSKHVLSVTNPFGATGEDVLETSKIIIDKVFKVTGVLLQPEPKFIGFDS